MSTATASASPVVVQNSGEWLGNDGQWSTFYVRVGTPPQHFQVLPSLNSQTIYIALARDCESILVSNCSASRGAETIASNSSTSSSTAYGFQPNASSTWTEIGQYDLEPGTKFALDGTSLYGYDRAGISLVGDANDTVTLEQQAVSAYSTPSTVGLSRLWLGRLGLSQSSLTINNTDRPVSFLHALKQKGHIPSLSFGYQAGAAYRYNKTAGSLVLGGYDKSRRSNGTITIPTTTDLIVGVQSITAQLRGGSITVLNSGVLAVLDTTVPELWLPHNVCDQIATVLNLTYHDDTGYYTLTDTAHNALQSLNGSLDFRIGSDVHVDPVITIEIPYKAFDIQASWPIFNSTTRYFPLRKTANKTQYALGRIFLQEAYLVVDWERSKFELSQAVFSNPMPEPNIITIQPNNNQTTASSMERSGAKMSPGAIAGVVIGVCLLVAVIASGIWLWQRKRKQEKQAKHSDVFHVLQGHGKQGPAELAFQARIEVEGARDPRWEMYAPPKPHELGVFNGENARFEVYVPPVMYEMGDTGMKDECFDSSGANLGHQLQGKRFEG